jgi:mRNA-degrading endonuclease RelE of RelBE toxin-antitoxin system
VPPFDIVAPPSVFRALDDLGDDDYDLVAEAILALAITPIPPPAKRLRPPSVRVRRADGTLLDGPLLSVRCRTSQGGRRGGSRIIYVVDHRGRRVCLARIAQRDEATCADLARLRRGARFRSWSSRPDQPDEQ